MILLSVSMFNISCSCMAGMFLRMGGTGFMGLKGGEFLCFFIFTFATGKCKCSISENLFSKLVDFALLPRSHKNMCISMRLSLIHI